MLPIVFLILFSHVTTSSILSSLSFEALEKMSKICDSIGTHKLPDRHFSKRCICKPGFFGKRCERIARCRSGRAMNVSCIHPDEDFKMYTDIRCIRGQIDLEVCDCFPGYTGHLCQLSLDSRFPKKIQQLEPMTNFEKVVQHNLEQPHVIINSQQMDSIQHLDEARMLINVLIILSSVFLILILIVIYILCQKVRATRIKRQDRQRGGQSRSYLLNAPPSYSDIDIPTSSSAFPFSLPKPQQTITHDIPSSSRNDPSSAVMLDIATSRADERKATTDSESSSEQPFPSIPLKPCLHV